MASSRPELVVSGAHTQLTTPDAARTFARHPQRAGGRPTPARVQRSDRWRVAASPRLDRAIGEPPVLDRPHLRQHEQRDDTGDADDRVDHAAEAAGLLARAAAEDGVDEVEVEESDQSPVDRADDRDDEEDLLGDVHGVG